MMEVFLRLEIIWLELDQWAGLRKLDNMVSAQNSPHLIGAESWQVKMRMINRDLVLPRQVIKQKISML